MALNGRVPFPFSSLQDPSHYPCFSSRTKLGQSHSGEKLLWFPPSPASTEPGVWPWVIISSFWASVLFHFILFVFFQVCLGDEVGSFNVLLHKKSGLGHICLNLQLQSSFPWLITWLSYSLVMWVEIIPECSCLRWCDLDLTINES